MSALIISPSGNFYGSEQVLFDYLTRSSGSSSVFVNNKGVFFELLKKSGLQNQLGGFDPQKLRRFYGGLLIHLFRNKFQTVYWNEAGHINYVILLAKLFPRVRFIVHVRIIEDTDTRRWVMKPGPNIEFISVSKFIRENFKYTSTLLYDPFHFEENNIIVQNQNDILRVGVIGRLTFTKGLNAFTHLFSCLANNGNKQPFRFIFYGEVSDDLNQSDWMEKNGQYEFVEFAGFQKDRKALYNSIDCVLHLSQQEALGRIFLEAINANKALIGFNKAGIGEVGGLLQLQDILMEPGNNSDFTQNILDKLWYVQKNRGVVYSRTKAAKKIAKGIFSMENYVSVLDKMLLY